MPRKIVIEEADRSLEKAFNSVNERLRLIEDEFKSGLPGSPLLIDCVEAIVNRMAKEIGQLTFEKNVVLYELQNHRKSTDVLLQLKRRLKELPV